MMPLINARSLILWNSGSYATYLKGMTATQRVSVNKQDAESIINATPEIQSAVILAELDWKNKRLMQFDGMDLLCELRTHYRLMCPIAVCSLMPFETMKRRFPILEYRPLNHPFFQLPVDFEFLLSDLRRAESLNDSSLDDTVWKFCHLRGRAWYLITHGRGFRLLRNPAASMVTETYWGELSANCDLLRKYIAYTELPELFRKNALCLVGSLESAIDERNIVELLNLKDTYFETLHSFDKISGDQDE